MIYVRVKKGKKENMPTAEGERRRWLWLRIKEISSNGRFDI